MRTSTSTTIGIFFGLLGPLAAQNYEENSTLAPERNDQAIVSTGPAARQELPVILKAKASPEEPEAVFPAQDTLTLEPKLPRNRNVDAVVDLGILQQPSPYRNVTRRASEIPAERVQSGLNLISAVYRESGKPETSCEKLTLSVQQGIRLDDSKLLEIVDTEVRANPKCACEIVKAAIGISDADTGTVLSIVETSVIAAPEMMRLISQCAIAADPQSLAGVQAILAKYDANSGDGGDSAKSAKSAKDAKAPAVGMHDDVAAIPNPLDFPGKGPVGPTPGGQGGQPLVPSIPVVNISPPVVTDADP
jgi:hypothetical protein